MKMPVIFVGHGSPMIAITHNEHTEELKRVGDYVLKTYGKPKAILMISGHWYQNDFFIQTDEHPKQIYDMYGFPNELYEVKYEVDGYRPLSDEVIKRMGDKLVSVNNDWGIDHGTWSVLVHMFPKADIPIVQLSVNARLNAKGSYLTGELLSDLREEGYLIMGSGNVVHNLREVDWENPKGNYMSDGFDAYIKEAILKRDDEKVINYSSHKYASYAVPTPDHFLPLVYMLGASQGDHATVFNDYRELGSMAMTSYLFESKE
jgi:4,5-DOPA dioxygenase extradiol